LSLPRKKAKIHLDNLPWKTVATPNTGLDGDEGIMGLEEVEGVQVIYEDTDAGRTVKFKVIEVTDLGRLV
jgi:ATP-dependent RNA helicase DDX24/MAK5